MATKTKTEEGPLPFEDYEFAARVVIDFDPDLTVDVMIGRKTLHDAYLTATGQRCLHRGGEVVPGDPRYHTPERRRPQVFGRKVSYRGSFSNHLGCGQGKFLGRHHPSAVSERRSLRRPFSMLPSRRARPAAATDPTRPPAARPAARRANNRSKSQPRAADTHQTSA
jgi:hypothetical protein